MTVNAIVSLVSLHVYHDPFLPFSGVGAVLFTV